MKLKDACSLEESYDQPRQHFKRQRHYFVNKDLSGQGYGFSSSHVWMWELECEESWALKNRCFWTVVLEKTLESPLDCKEIQPINLKGNQSWIFWCWSWNSKTLAIRCQELLTHWKRPWCWERLKAKEEEGGRGWDGWVVSLIQWRWIWTNPGDSRGQRSLAWGHTVGHDLRDWTTATSPSHLPSYKLSHSLSQSSSNIFPIF